MEKSQVKDRKMILFWESDENLMEPWVQFWQTVFNKDNTLDSVGGKKRMVTIFFWKYALQWEILRSPSVFLSEEVT